MAHFEAVPEQTKIDQLGKMAVVLDDEYDAWALRMRIHGKTKKVSAGGFTTV